MIFNLIAAGLGLAGSLLSSNSNKKAVTAATTASTNATNTNNALLQGIYDENKATLSPFVQQGVGANGQINAMLANNPYQSSTGATFQADPGYEFQRDEGLRGLASSAAYGGSLRSGGAVKDAIRFNSGMANQGYGQWWNRDQAQLSNNNNATGSFLNALQSQQQIGMGAASAQAGVGQNFANNTSNNNWQNANNAGNAAIAGANNTNAMWGNLINAGSNFAGQWQQGRGSSYGQSNLRGLY